MADALMRISSMQSDRVDRAYRLARQNRLDDQALRRIDNDSQRLILEAERNRATLDQQDLARDRFEAGQTEIAAQRQQDAASTWYEMQSESGAFIRTDETTGAPMATGEQIIQMISENQPIAHLTDRDYTESDPHRRAMATDAATAAALRGRQEADIAAGIDPSSGLPLGLEQQAARDSKYFEPTLGRAFDTSTAEGQDALLQARGQQEYQMRAAQEMAKATPKAGMTPKDRVGLGDVYVRDAAGERWMEGANLAGALDIAEVRGETLEVVWGREHMDRGVPPPDGALPVGALGGAPTGAPIGIPAAALDQGFRSGGIGRGSSYGEQDIPGPGAMPDDTLQVGGPMLGDTLQAGAPAAGSWAIDRIEGDIAVLVADDGSGTTEVPLASLPPGSQEGSVLRNAGDGWVLDEEARAARLSQGGAAMGGLGARDPGGDLMVGAL
jgi:hypothetical protein|tara:strand:- start:2434 stop:3756 length:1323 start_codon:yes stop_codon:yes gene_type:complete